METYADILRRLADSLDEDFSKNLCGVVGELFNTLRSLMAIEAKKIAG